MAGPTRAAGYVDYSSTSASKFIPELWSSRFIEKFYGTTVFGEIASTDYEGEIKGYGDNIIIRSAPDVVVSDYQIGSTFAASDYQLPTASTVELPIDKAKKFLLRLNSVDRAQSDLNLMDTFLDAGTRQMQIELDKQVLAGIVADVSADNQGDTAGKISDNINLGTVAAPLNVSTTNAVDLILNLGQVLDEQNIPPEGRWLILPAWFVKLLKGSELRQAYLTGDSVSPLRNGKIGEINGFTIFLSNHLSVTASGDAGTGGKPHTNVLCGINPGLAWASQVTEMEQMQNPWDFGTLARGLMVYGFKVVEPKYLALARIRPA